MAIWPAIVAFFVAIWILSGIRIVYEYERGVIFRLGRFSGIKEAGLKWIIPGIDSMNKIDMRVKNFDVTPQEVMTKDNVPVAVNAIIYFRVWDSEKSVIEVENFITATTMLSQTTLRNVVGRVSLDELLSERDKVNVEIQGILDEKTDPWGIKVSAVEIKDVQIPKEMQRAIAHEAEAERDRRAIVIKAMGELQASEELKKAAMKLEETKVGIQLRMLQTISEVGTENNTVVVFPIPMEMMGMFRSSDDK
jgi:regulator of protease activity HflC (stomatin/prohibitin superfamily)